MLVTAPFGGTVRVHAYRFAFEIPKEVRSETAGPLMCGGATVFTPLEDHDVKDGRGCEEDRSPD